MAGHQHEVALGGERDELVHLGCAHRRRLLDEDVLARLERAAWRARSASAPASRSRPRRASRRPSISSKLAVALRVRIAARERVEALADRRRRSRRGRRARRSCARGSAPSSRARRRRRVRHSFQTFPSTSAPFVALRKSTITLPRRTTSLVVDRRVRGDDHDAVVAFGLERHGAQAVELGHVRVVVGDVGAGVPEQLDDLLGRRLADVVDVGLVRDAEDEDLRAARATSARRGSAPARSPSGRSTACCC